METLRNKVLDQIYITAFFRSTGRSLIRLFVPMYLMSLGYTLTQVAVYYFIFNYISWIIWACVVASLIDKIGIKFCFFASEIISTIDVVLLFNLKQYDIPLPAVSVIHGMSEACFWTAHQLHFLRASNNNTRGRIISIIRIITKVGRSIGPAIGGWFLQEMQVTALIITSTTLLIISMIPLYWLDTSQGPGINEQVESNDIIPQTIKERETPVKDQKLANVVAFISNAIEKSFGNSLWSVYTALTFFDQKVKLFGAFSSVVLMLSLIITYAIGKFVDTERLKSLWIGMAASVTIWLYRVYVSSPLDVAVSDILYSIANTVFSISVFANLYSRAKSQTLLQFVLVQQICSAVGDLLAWVFVWFFSAGESIPNTLFIIPPIVIVVQAIAIKVSN